MRAQGPVPVWNGVARSLHWLTLLLLLVVAALGIAAEEQAMGPAKLQLFATHKSFGLTILALVLLRLCWRAMSSSAAPVEGLGAAGRRAAGFGHGALYLLLLMLPLSGWWLTSVANFPFHWFGLFEVPMLAPADKSAQQLAKEVHEILFWTLAVLVAGHVIMVVLHQRKGLHVAGRMLPARAGLFLALLMSAAAMMVLAILFSSGALGNAPAAGTVASSQQQQGAVDPAQRLSAAEWRAGDASGTLEFVGSYLGSEFVGRFRKFQVAIDFDPEQPGQAAIEVWVDVRSATLGSADMDAMLPDPAWFATGTHPTAHYRSVSARRSGDAFVAEGRLSLKGASKPVAISFDWRSIDDQSAHMRVSASLNRRDFAIGSGEWADDDSIAFDVEVRAELQLQRSAAKQ